MKPFMLLEACNYASTCSIKNRIYPLKNVFLVVQRIFTKFCDIMLQCPKHNLCFPAHECATFSFEEHKARTID